MKRFKNLIQAQFAVFEQIATGGDAGHHPATLKALVQKNMIIEIEEKLGGVMPLVITRYEVPLRVHIEWCRWCAAND